MFQAATDQWPHVENDDNLAIGGNRATQDARDTADLRADLFDHDFLVPLQSVYPKCSLAFTASNH